jgi:hypothetical protein
VPLCRFAARLASRGCADVRAELIEVLTGMLKVPAPEGRLIGSNEHPNQDKAPQKRDQEQNQSHRKQCPVLRPPSAYP